MSKGYPTLPLPPLTLYAVRPVRFDSECTATTKGQIISEEIFVFSILPKSEQKFFALNSIDLGQKFEFSSLFFGRIEDIKKTFRN